MYVSICGWLGHFETTLKHTQMAGGINYVRFPISFRFLRRHAISTCDIVRNPRSGT
ncbi:hypothetical protein OG21DRAFT_637556 [Imleria badia]|nr:hypothetical protein OG21DRAFT_637556 [Imleria badia]